MTTRSKLLIILLSFGLLALGSIAPTFASSPLTIQINGSDVAAAPFAYASGGQVMVPIRWIAGQLGATLVQWDPKQQNVSIDTGEDFYHLSKLESFANELSSDENTGSQLLPLPKRVTSISAIPLLDPKTLDELNDFTQKYLDASNPVQITVTIINKPQSYSYSSAVYCFENHGGHIYVPMCLIDFLFYTKTIYNANSNLLTIQTPNIDDVKQQLAQIESILTPESPEEVVNLWGRGEQTRNGALQYTALSPDLRQQVDNKFLASGLLNFWVTGVSSPWVGPITVQERKKLSANKMEFTITFPEVTSSPPNPTATEKFDVEQLSVGGQKGWFITKMLQSSGYGLL